MTSGALKIYLTAFALTLSLGVSAYDIFAPRAQSPAYENFFDNPNQSKVEARPWEKMSIPDLNNDAHASILDTSNLYCSKIQSDNELLSLSNHLDWSVCYNRRIRSSDQINTPKAELLKSEVDACKCLREMPVISDVINENVLSNVTLNKNSDVSKKINEKVEGAHQEAQSTRLNGILFQASVISQNANFVAGYASNLFRKGEGINDVNVTFQPSEKIINEKFPFDHKDQCVSGADYMVTRMYPEPRDRKYLLEEIKKGYDFHAWNFKTLRKRYDHLVSLSHNEKNSKQAKQEIYELKAKLKFLNRNPMIKYLLTSNANEDHNNSLFEVMKDLTNPDCSDFMSSCAQDYRKKLANLFASDSNVVQIVREEIKNDVLEQAEKKLNGNLLGEKKNKVPSQSKLISTFMKNYKLESPDKCEIGNFSLECLNIYSAYCKSVDEYQDEIMSLNNEAAILTDDLDEILANDFNPDYNTNPDFRKFNDRYCLGKRSEKGISTILNRNLNFFEWQKKYCKKNSDVNCKLDSSEAYATLRHKFYLDFPEDRSRDKDSTDDDGGLFSGGSVKLVDLSPSVLNNADLGGRIVNFKPFEVKSDVSSDVSKVLMPEMKFDQTAQAPISSDRLNDQPYFKKDMVVPALENYMNYSSSMIDQGSMAQNASKEAPRIENMSDGQKKDLLEDWEKQYSDWKQEKTGTKLSQADVQKESQLKQEIESLKALLSQQQQVTQQQMQLLNEALAAKSEESLAKERTMQDRSQAVERRPSSINPHMAQSDDESVGGVAQNASQAINASQNGNKSGASTSSSQAPSVKSTARVSSSDASSADSVAREEAKLVNLRSFSDGSIIIESGSSRDSTVNAITVPVSDEQYRVLQTNPAGLNLKQIENIIPKEQIAKLEKKGEIILLLKNGSNPPFEVKVAKKENGLVYSLRDDEKNKLPVRRVYTREALQSELISSGQPK